MKKRNTPNSVIVFTLVFFFTAASVSASPREDEKGIVAMWKFNKTKDKTVQDSVNGIHDEISGNFWSNDPILKKYITLVLFFDILIACL